MRNINYLSSKYFDQNLRLKIKQNLNKIFQKVDIEQKHFIKIYVLAFCLLLLRIFPYVTCNFTIFLFPFLETNKILQEEKLSDNYKKWNFYWSLFGIGILLDQLFLAVIEYFPFYFLLKFFLFTWLGLPNFNGTNYILENYYFDFINEIKKFLKYEDNKKTISYELDIYINNKKGYENLSK